LKPLYKYMKLNSINIRHVRIIKVTWRSLDLEVTVGGINEKQTYACPPDLHHVLLRLDQTYEVGNTYKCLAMGSECKAMEARTMCQ
jgi:hypothetical protein